MADDQNKNSQQNAQPQSKPQTVDPKAAIEPKLVKNSENPKGVLRPQRPKE